MEKAKLSSVYHQNVVDNLGFDLVVWGAVHLYWKEEEEKLNKQKLWVDFLIMFLAVQNSSLGDLVTHSLTH